MVYDPIRDCEIPSPAVARPSPSAGGSGWRDFAGPSPSPGGGELYDDSKAGTSTPSSSTNGRHSYSHSLQRQLPHGPPPAFQQPHQSPTALSARSISGGLRGLLNDEGPSSRPSTGPGEEDRRHSGQGVSRLLNEAAPVISKTNSASSYTQSSASDPSPRQRHQFLDTNGMVMSSHDQQFSVPHSTRQGHTSRSPGAYGGYSAASLSPPTPSSALPLQEGHPYPHLTQPHPQYANPHFPTHPPLPPQYAQHQFPYPSIHTQVQILQAESSSRRMSNDSQAFPHPHTPISQGQPTSGQMMPPGVPRYTGEPSPSTMRASVSISPRGQHQSLYPPQAASSSRPTSSTSSNHPFSFQPPTAQPSPASSLRRLSEDHPLSSVNSAPVSVNGRRQTAPLPVSRGKRPSATPSIPSVRSPSPIHRSMYNPNRVTQPHTVLRPILPGESHEFRRIGQVNNPLRRRNRRPLPSWSGPPSSKLSGPQESDGSYFPPQSDEPQRSQSLISNRRGSMGSYGRPSLTPGPSFAGLPGDRDNGRSVKSREPTPRLASGEETRKSRLKRETDHEESEAAHDHSRRKVVDTRQYIGNAGEVANHYNARPEVGVKNREQSPIIGLKKFNNWIKSVLIGKFAFRPGAKVLDIGCGKGGDLNKWTQAQIGLYVGLDIAATSVEQAWDRYRKLGPRARFEAHFFAHDCYANPLSEVLPKPLQQPDLFDNVTMQFCMHYAFENASKARMMIENVSRHLRPGGRFIGTIPDGDQLLERLNAVPEDAEDLRFGNSCFYIQFTERRHKGKYGHQYRFYLTDAVDDVPEYIVDWPNFEALANEYRLRLVYKQPFHQILQEEQSSRDFGPLLLKMGVVSPEGQSAMDADQWEAANLYQAFAFEKF